MNRGPWNQVIGLLKRLESAFERDLPDEGRRLVPELQQAVQVVIESAPEQSKWVLQVVEPHLDPDVFMTVYWTELGIETLAYVLTRIRPGCDLDQKQVTAVCAALSKSGYIVP